MTATILFLFFSIIKITFLRVTVCVFLGPKRFDFGFRYVCPFDNYIIWRKTPVHVYAESRLLISSIKRV